jgi:phosphate transport system permease protein
MSDDQSFASISVLIFVATAAAFFLSRRRILSLAGNALTGAPSVALHSRPNYHGAFAGSLVAVASAAAALAVSAFGGGVVPAAGGALLAAGVAGLVAFRAARPDFRARVHVETFVKAILAICSGVAVVTTLGIFLSLIFESLRFFAQVPPLDFLTGLQWSPQTAMREDQAGQSGAFGAVPVFIGTLMITGVAMLVALPIGLMIAFYLAEYAPSRARAAVKPAVELLAGVPTVVYGYFALLTVGPAIRGVAEAMGLAVPTQSAFAAGAVMGVMIIPFISSLSDDVINAVPQSLRDGAYALGATKSETLLRVVFPAALPGIVGAFLLGVSRAIGETMIVVMAAGRAANLSANPFEAMTTVTVQIVAVLTGDQEFDSPKTLSAFALGLTLFVVTLILNVIALIVVRSYRDRYE